MSKFLRGHWSWLVGGLVSASVLGACGAPEEQNLEVAEPAAAGDVKVQLSLGKATLAAGDSVSVSVTLTNVSGRSVKLPYWTTAARGVKEPLFDVQLNGAPVAYTGPHYKWAAPQAEDFITLAPGQSVTHTADVGGVYDFSATGSYSLSYASEAHGQVAQFASNNVTVWVEGRPGLQPQGNEGNVSAQALSYSGACTSSEQSSISTAFNSAKTYSTNSLSYLTNTTPGNTARYKTWFGNYTSTNWNTAKNHFSAIKSAFDTKSVVVDCSCNDSAYAYVYPASPYKIYVCNAFWSAPNTGTDSRAGTLVHEMSHFNVVAATDDHAYGQSAAKSLATSNPTRALDNADSHEYFAENTPAQN
ncbi:M35 family metallo-endopeptidase [Hyalangium rubrum]|uniref:M35 family metallo-endopeptidase n=1 Tax=Hyalangium rubrum TaxID=3103134 RepID=A0ABU5HBQ1_9BACT|nr:M35 family metallo-endopeptidase [Hyalangium sp. s54d21]MDY7230557.1 M35 family metallo-endopeptidase [Hyalangium sp. s54d21]